METIYNVDYFIKKFEAIPEIEWCTRGFGVNGNHCAYGHCGMTDSLEFKKVPEAYALGNLLFDVVDINDDRHPNYQQPTPKQRILAALYDIKGNSAVNEAVAIVSQSSPENILA